MDNNTCTVDDCEGSIRCRGLCEKHYTRLRRHGTTAHAAKKTVSVEDRFWSMVKKTPTCWEWQAAIVRGYGHITIHADGKRKIHKAHRIAYELLVGPIPDKHGLDHMCHNKACVNPAHLRPTTQKQNMENRTGPNANTKSGIRGVHWSSRHKKWSVVIGHNMKHVRGGYFTDKEEAGEVAKQLRNKLFTHSDADAA